MTKGITMATAKAVAAGNSCRQEDVIATANLSRRAIADMLRACKVEIPAVRQKCEAALGQHGREEPAGTWELSGILRLTYTLCYRKPPTTRKWLQMCGSEPCTLAVNVPTATWSC